MAFLDAFRDWLDKTGDFQVETNTQDPTTGEIAKSWTNAQTNVNFGIYTTSTQQTNLNDKFVNQKILEAVFDPEELTITPTVHHRLVYNSENYYIEGEDDIQFQGELLELKLRKEYV